MSHPQLAGLPGFSPIQAYGLGLPQSFAQGIGTTQTKYDLKTLGGFLEDSWRIVPRKLTLNYGVRYDVEGFPTTRRTEREHHSSPNASTASAKASACRIPTSPPASAHCL